MKTLKVFIIVALTILTCETALVAQQKESASRDRLEVTTSLQETNGSYDERKLYRGFLTEAMKHCPYIHHFHIIAYPDASKNNYVQWVYEVNSWDDITKFYSWINTTMHDASDSTLIKALTPYKPSYNVGGAIDVHQKGEKLVNH